jgi:hypothetical protein
MTNTKNNQGQCKRHEDIQSLSKVVGTHAVLRRKSIYTWDRHLLKLKGFVASVPTHLKLIVVPESGTVYSCT